MAQNNEVTIKETKNEFNRRPVWDVGSIEIFFFGVTVGGLLLLELEIVVLVCSDQIDVNERLVGLGGTSHFLDYLNERIRRIRLTTSAMYERTQREFMYSSVET